MSACEAMTAAVAPKNATLKTVTWSSADPTVATVDEDGVVTAVGGGTTTITVTSTDKPGLSASMTLTVTGGSIPLNDDGTSQNEAESRAF